MVVFIELGIFLHIYFTNYIFSLLFADVEWPSGSYGLPRSKSGCPGDKTSGWNEGWRFQDMEDEKKSSRSSESEGSHLDVKFIGGKKDINRTFCMKKNAKTLTKYWPKGRFSQSEIIIVFR